MTYPKIDIVQKAHRKMKTRIVKLSFGLYMLIFILISATIMSLFEFVPVRQEYKTDLGALVASVSSTSFLLLMLKIQWITSNRWRFWVLKEVHYLQDFIAIRKMAEQKKYIYFNEDWLKKNYIIKRSKGKSRKELLEKLEIFEYAFNKDFDTNLPKTLVYGLRKRFLIGNILVSGIITALLFTFLIFGHFKRGWAVIMNENLALFIFLVLISLFALFVFLRNLRKFVLRKTIYLKFSPQGVYLRRFRKYGRIDWKYVKGIKYVQKTPGDAVIHTLYVDFKKQYYGKFGRKYCAINLNYLNVDIDLLEKQINTVASKYISDN